MIKFGIRISTYCRPNKLSRFLVRRCLKSINNQTYPYWKLFFIGDHYIPDSEFKYLSSLVDTAKIEAVNLPYSPERQKYTGSDLWKVAGFSASSLGLQFIQKNGLICVCLDDDDVWLPDHLETLAQGYEKFPRAAFIYTQATHKNQLLPLETPELAYNNLEPRAYNLIHSAASWDTKRIPLKYRNIIEEKVDLVAGDADMWERIRNYCHDNDLCYLYIPKLTVRHDNEWPKEVDILPLL